MELVARLLQGPRRLYARRTLLAACGPEPRAEELVPGERSPGTPPLPPPAERDRDAPSVLVVLPRAALGGDRRWPPSPGTLRRRAAASEGCARRLVFSNPLTASRTPATDLSRWKRGRGTPSVTSPRPGYVGDSKPTVQHAPQGPSHRRARPPGPAAPAPLRAPPRPAPDLGPRRWETGVPTWLILPVAYACLKD